MQTLTPIETEFKGYRFRSRLEARWGVFFSAFDTVLEPGVAWAYEPQGFVLSNGGGNYLPDFSLTIQSGRTTWFEVKPYENAPGIAKFRAFRREVEDALPRWREAWQKTRHAKFTELYPPRKLDPQFDLAKLSASTEATAYANAQVGPPPSHGTAALLVGDPYTMLVEGKSRMCPRCGEIAEPNRFEPYGMGYLFGCYSCDAEQPGGEGVGFCGVNWVWHKGDLEIPLPDWHNFSLFVGTAAKVARQYRF